MCMLSALKDMKCALIERKPAKQKENEIPHGMKKKQTDVGIMRVNMQT